MSYGTNVIIIIFAYEETCASMLRLRSTATPRMAILSDGSTELLATTMDEIAGKETKEYRWQQVIILAGPSGAFTVNRQALQVTLAQSNLSS